MDAGDSKKVTPNILINPPAGNEKAARANDAVSMSLRQWLALVW